MKEMLTTAAAALLLVGCASTENGYVSTAPDGTPVYGLNDQPQTSVGGTGPLLPGTYEIRQPATGQFTGRERTPDLVGQYPSVPRETDARLVDHSATPLIGSGAGSLGQSGITPNGVRLNGTTLTEAPLNPAAQPSSSDIYRPPGMIGRGSEAMEAVGSAPGIEQSSANSKTNNPPATSLDSKR